MIDVLRAVAFAGMVLVGAPLMTFFTVLAAGLAQDLSDEARAKRRATKGDTP